MSIKKSLGDFWKWLWKSESIWSYIIFLILVFVIIKYVFLPGLSLAFGMGLNGLPLAIVESSSMDHHSLAISPNAYNICGANFQKSSYFNKDQYWNTCGLWYEDRNITKEQFSKFNFANGFRKGDIVIIFKKKTISVGDVIVFSSTSRHPIIHRVISTSPILQTKGDHNEAQLVLGNNQYGADETNVRDSQIVGTAVGKIPWLGWPKLFIVELWNKIFG